MPDIRARLVSLCAAFNAHDLDAIMAHFADDAVLEMPRGPDPWGARSEGRAPGPPLPNSISWKQT